MNLFFLILTICSMVFLLISMKENDMINDVLRRKFSFVCLMIIIGQSIDFLIWRVNLDFQSKSNVIIQEILATIDLCIIPFVICYLAHVIYTNNKIIILISKIICATNIALMVMNLFFHFIFSVDKGEQYFRAKYWNVYFYMCILGFIFLLYQLHCLTRINQNKSIGSFLTIAIASAIEIIYILSTPFSGVDWIVIFAIFDMIYVYYVNSELSIDGVTLLLNAKNFRNRIKTINFNTVVIFADCNNFKFINDHYGHIEGDIALKEYANALLTVFRKYAWVYRRSGDEFVVIFKPNIIDLLISSNEKKDFNSIMTELFKQLNSNIEKREQKVHYLKLGLSCGYGIYIPYANSNFNSMDSTSTKFLTVDEAICNAESYAYRQKRKNASKIEKIQRQLLQEISNQYYV